MSEIGAKGAAAASEETSDEDLLHDPEEAKLVATQEALKEVGDTVNELVRTNSLAKDSFIGHTNAEKRAMTNDKFFAQ